MKKQAIILSKAAAASLFAVLMLVLGGCEDNEDNYEHNLDPGISALGISPSSASLNAEDRWIVFSAVGGTAPYSWSIRDKSLGTLDTSVAITVVYNRVGTGEGANIIHVRDANNWISEAMIRHTTNTVSTGVTHSVTSP